MQPASCYVFCAPSYLLLAVHCFISSGRLAKANMLFRLMLSDIGTETLSTKENPFEMLLANCVPLRDELLNTKTGRGLPRNPLPPVHSQARPAGTNSMVNRVVVVVVVRLEHSHSFNDSLDNHSTASGPAWCRRCRPPGNAVSGQSSTMCLVVWWLSQQGQAGDAITPHRWRDSAHLAWPHLRRFSVTNWRLGRVNPGCGHVGSVTRSCPGGTP